MIRIITDTTACLPIETALRFGITVIPQIIHFGEQSFYEGVDIDITAFMSRLRSSNQLPKTSAPPPELFVQQFEKFAFDGDTILCIHPSSEVSGTVRSALTACQEFPHCDIRVIDTRVAASPLGSMVCEAARLAVAGVSADRVVQHLMHLVARCRVYFLIENLEYLQRGGRIGGASALLGSILQVKPILTVRDGTVQPFTRERTSYRALARIKELVLNQAAGDGTALVTIMHAGRQADGLRLAEDLLTSVNQAHIPVVDMCPSIVTHGGPGILGVGFFAGD